MEFDTAPRRPQGFDGPHPISLGSVVRSELVAEARLRKAQRLRRERFRREYGTILIVSAIWIVGVATIVALYTLA